jgi:UTP--glucose-1-phosphate uridylyltransferase
MARKVVNDEPFAVLLADDLVLAEKPVLAQMMEQYQRFQTGILAVQEIRREDSSRYGVVAASPLDDQVFQLSRIVEKPRPENAPSNLGVVGRYILPARIFDFLEKTAPGAGGEIQLTDGIAGLIGERQVLAYRFAGQRFDCGDRLGYLQATIAFALRHPEVGAEFAQYLNALCAERQAASAQSQGEDAESAQRCGCGPEGAVSMAEGV